MYHVIDTRTGNIVSTHDDKRDATYRARVQGFSGSGYRVEFAGTPEQQIAGHANRVLTETVNRCIAEGAPVLIEQRRTVSIDEASARVLADADPGDRLYAIDEQGEGWHLVVSSDARTPVEVLAVCVTLMAGRRSSWRSARIDIVQMTMAWVEPESGGRLEREHVLGLEAVLAGWS